jgi:vacuolar-type H+-ATPase subunit E/Vma4
MALEQLLTSLTRDADTAIADLLRAAREEAEAVRAAAAAERRQRHDVAVAHTRRALEAALEEDSVEAGREASRAVLRVREELLARILARARAGLATRHADATGAATALLREAASYLGDAPAILRCAGAMRSALEPVARELGLEPVTDDTVGPGAVLATKDGRLSVDATLEQHLLRTWPDEAIRLGARLEAVR